MSGAHELNELYFSFQNDLRSADALEAKVSPEKEPYKFKYEARAVLDGQLKALNETAASTAADIPDLDLLRTRIKLRKGINFIDTEENTTGDRQIGESLQKGMPVLAALLGSVRSRKAPADSAPLICGIVGFASDIIRACGHRSLILTGWSRPRAALKHLRLAKRVHSEVLPLLKQAPAVPKDGDSDIKGGSSAVVLADPSAHEVGRAGEPAPVPPARLHELSLQLEAAYTHTTFYYAQVYASMQETSAASRYVRVTLERQLIGYSSPHMAVTRSDASADGQDELAAAEHSPGDDAADTKSTIGASIDRIEWSRNAVRLCNFYKARRWWQHAARCLGAAECMLQHHKQQRTLDVMQATSAASVEDISPGSVEVGDRAKRVTAEVSLYRGRLLLDVLDTARERDVQEEIKADRLGPAGTEGMLYKRRRRMAVPVPLAEAASNVRTRSDMPLRPGDGSESGSGAAASGTGADDDAEDDDFDVDIGDSESDLEDEVETKSPPAGGAGEGAGSRGTSAPSSGAEESKLSEGERLLAPSEVALPFASFMQECADETTPPATPPSLDPKHPTPKDVNSFPQARTYFKRANAHFATALKYFKLDGFVTDYVRIQEDKAGLYRCLVGFESTPQRAQAMHLRRVGLQAGLLGVLNPSIFIVNHKELSHQCAMAAREAAEIKMQLVDDAFEQSQKAPSLGELNGLCKVVDRAIFFNLHFLRCFSDKRLPAGGPPVPRCISERADLIQDVMRDAVLAKEQPSILADGGYAGGSQDKPLVGATEIDSGTTMAYLNAAFVVAHLVNKRLDPTAAGRVRDCVDAQAGFKWVVDNCKKLLDSPGLSTDDPSTERRVVGADGFKQELEVCVEMSKLLAVKADRLRQQLRAAGIAPTY